MDLHSVTGQLPELHVLHQSHQTVDVDLLQQVSQQQLHQELQQQQVVGLVDHSQSIRSKLENINYQLHNLSGSGNFQRLHLAANWRLSEKNQVRGRS